MVARSYYRPIVTWLEAKSASHKAALGNLLARHR